MICFSTSTIISYNVQFFTYDNSKMFVNGKNETYDYVKEHCSFSDNFCEISNYLYNWNETNYKYQNKYLSLDNY